MELYNAHLKAALEWGNIWYTIKDSILSSVNQEADKKYRTINTKLNQLMKTQTNNPDFHKQFYPRVINNTNITFTNDEMALLNNGLKYNLGHKPRGWITTLVLEAETAISQLPNTEQEYIRYQAAYNIRQLYKQHNEIHPINTAHITREKQTLNKIRQKLITSNAIVTKADKGNSVVIIYQEDYHDNVKKFINDHNLTTVNSDPTRTFQKELRSSVKECHNLIMKEEKWKYVNLNPSAPSIRGLIKMHKPNSPIRPIVNWKQAPAYKIAKLLAKKLQQYIPLPNTFNVRNSTHLIQDLADIPFDPNLHFVSFDITNMYTNIPTEEPVNIIDSLCKEHLIQDRLRNEIIKISELIIRQNYFQFQNHFYIQENGLAIGSPTSSVFSEIFLEHIESTAIYKILKQNRIIGYFRYVDDILIIYNKSITNIQEVFKAFNNVTPNIKFTKEDEIDNSINKFFRHHNKEGK
jgi:hypothetical protein